MQLDGETSFLDRPRRLARPDRFTVQHDRLAYWGDWRLEQRRGVSLRQAADIDRARGDADRRQAR